MIIVRSLCGAAASGVGIRRLLVAAALALQVSFAFVGCATIGREFPVDRVSQIRLAETTRDEIRALFGPPWRVGIEDGRPTWTYGRYRYRLFGQASTEDLVIRFDARGVVSSYTFNTTEHDE